MQIFCFIIRWACFYRFVFVDHKYYLFSLWTSFAFVYPSFRFDIVQLLTCLRLFQRIFHQFCLALARYATKHMFYEWNDNKIKINKFKPIKFLHFLIVLFFFSLIFFFFFYFYEQILLLLKIIFCFYLSYRTI